MLNLVSHLPWAHEEGGAEKHKSEPQLSSICGCPSAQGWWIRGATIHLSHSCPSYFRGTKLFPHCFEDKLQEWKSLEKDWIAVHFICCNNTNSELKRVSTNVQQVSENQSRMLSEGRRGSKLNIMGRYGRFSISDWRFGCFGRMCEWNPSTLISNCFTAWPELWWSQFQGFANIPPTALTSTVAFQLEPKSIGKKLSEWAWDIPGDWSGRNSRISACNFCDIKSPNSSNVPEDQQ